MKTLKMMVMALLLAIGPAVNAQNMTDADKSISETVGTMEKTKEQIKKINDQIKDYESKLKELKQQKKALEKSLKEGRRSVSSTVFDNYVLMVINNRYDQTRCSQALGAMQNVEKGDALNYKKLIKNYGQYTESLRKALVGQKKKIEVAGGFSHRLDAADPALVAFKKAIKGTDYYGKYSKKQSIIYLNKIYSRIEQMIASGLGSESQYNAILNDL